MDSIVTTILHPDSLEESGSRDLSYVSVRSPLICTYIHRTRGFGVFLIDTGVLRILLWCQVSKLEALAHLVHGMTPRRCREINE